ncbi:MAG: methionine--tRNA ligase [Cytophagales bacterium]|nr:methionine--tRNA ligase [Cytophagales bacterium]
MNPDRYLVTAALLYANGAVHIGHLAGCYLPADIYTRYLRARGREVLFLSGTDEHGIPITLAAREKNISPRELVDSYHDSIKESLRSFGISFDIFDRTSSKHHHQTASDFFLKLHEKDCFESLETQQFFDEKEGIFLADRYVRGVCPVCSYEDAYGDQCEKCGRSLSPQELLEPRSLFGGPLSERKTTHWYLPMHRWQKEMESYVKDHSHWKSNVKGQCLSWLAEGLRSRAMTRDLDWGVPVPLPGASRDKVLYVWFDAPIGYISATQKYRPKDWERFWKDEKTCLIHFIGKDNIVFHGLIFPLMLSLHGEYILPHHIPANEFLNLEGNKISTSKNWAVWLSDFLETFPENVDTLRYVLCANMPETRDGHFTWKGFQTAQNCDLVGVLGNFIHRVMVLTWKHLDGKVPHSHDLGTQENLPDLLKRLSAEKEKIERELDGFHFKNALSSFMNLVRWGNHHLTEQSPWKTINTNPQQAKSCLYFSLQLSASLCILSEPFLPFTYEKWKNLIRLPEGADWDQVGKKIFLPGAHTLSKPSHLFTPIEDSLIQTQIDKLSLKSSSRRT